MPVPSLPYITSDLPGTGGEIKLEPEHFVVREEPLYPPSGEGDHLFLSISRAGMTTRQVVSALARGLGISERDIGYAGLKDRQAAVTQVFSLPGITHPQLQHVADDLGFTVNWTAPNRGKLRTGHLLGNHFHITILHPTCEQPLAVAQRACTAIRERGLPNFFGAQRFGRYGDNADQGLAILLGQQSRPGAKWLYKLLLSAYQSALFNQYLAERMQRGWFDQILNGDLAKKTDTGGMFVVAERDLDQERFQRGEITFTGPLFGYKMRQPAADAAAFEAEIETATPVSLTHWRQHRVMGNRRAGKLFISTLEIGDHPQGYHLSFFLPKGAYATTLLREVMKTPQIDALTDVSDV